MEISIKKFEELSTLELYNIVRLREQVFIAEQECAYVECDNKDIKSYHLQLKKDDQLVGYLRILPAGISYDEASIGRIVVKKDQRKYKYGELIVKEAIKFLENELNETKIRISAQQYLVKFYNKFGFQTVGYVYLEDFIDHIQMYYEKNGDPSKYVYKSKLKLY